MPKIISEKQKADIINAFKVGETVDKIASDTRISSKTIRKILADIEIDKQIDEKGKVDPILAQASPKYIKKQAEHLSTSMVRETDQLIENAKSYRPIETIYRRSVEKMGMDWFEFLEVAVENLYQEVKEEYMKKVEEAELEKIRVGIWNS